ncbi:hypothetical protein PHLCEN_2v191 [Hermanssonia centrifuga]|uniref:Uncharacterized protein n=1 Tax=Hermanssonia centrifuga TaxID=98765 RepID=A0A2R6S6Q0_9APHY|nr:hypothetical protein PHLCEN_2v191 [Hermanssonia centrifuga]
MHTEDGRSIKAVAKEKEQARREHERAIRHGRMTGLVEHTTDDIFTISLGSLPSLQMITTKLTYVLDLMDNDLPDQVRLQLPVCIGMRFGTLPEGMVQAKTIPPERISLTTEVYMKGAIQSITSPSHSTLTLLPDGDTHKTTSVPSRVAEYRSPTFLSQDFILAIQAEGLDAPRCFAQRGPDGSVAMQLTVVPKFNLPTVSAQEYIFVVDRSASMAGARIEQAKRALVMLLRALPRQGTVFNIFSFGYRCDSLWGESRIYNAETLETATFHIDRMNADYGGTSIRSALEKVLSSSDTQLPTACFVLTDGEAYDINATIDVVTKAAAGAQTGSPLRVFTLGIGETTSSAMCEGIARAGNGVCLMAAASESIIAKCSKLVWASRTGILENVSVDWGVPQSALDSNSADDTQTTVLRQGPSKVSSIYTANRFVVLAIVESGTFDIPKEVVLRAQRHSGQIFTFAVPVEVLSNTAQEPQRPLIHTLAARRIIMDLEDIKRGHVSSETKALIIHLGERYQLASRYTSFIAVEGPDQEKLLPVDEESIKAKSDPVQAVESSVDEQEHARRSRSPTRITRTGSPRSPRRIVMTDRHSRSRSPIFVESRQSEGSVSPIRTVRTDTSRSRSPLIIVRTAEIPLQSVDDEVVRLVRLQSFDGSFPADKQLANIVGQEALDEAEKLCVDPVIWATVLAIAYLQKNLAQQPHLLEGLLEKANEFVQQSPDLDFKALLEKANSLLN